MNLVDPAVLYTQAHNTTSHSKLWREHHLALARFILSAELPCIQPVVEVGGASGDLARLLVEQLPRYSILDMSPAVPNQQFPVIQGNCEDFVFDSGSALILAHVFEHLYNPRTFVAHCARDAVADVFISIPNMAASSTVPIHVEHTFFVDSSDIIRMFASAGYVLCGSFDFQQHSHFYHMRVAGKGEPLMPCAGVSGPLAEARRNATVSLLKARQTYFESLHIPEGAFLSPGGLYGQVLYYYTRCKICCYLDNDECKQDKRVYGTPHFVRSFKVLEGAGPKAVFVYAGPYSLEIRKQITNFNREALITLL
jgi:hypothetical protein